MLPEFEQSPEHSRIGYRLASFADVIAEINLMSEQRGLSLLQRALENPTPSNEFVKPEIRDVEMDEIALTNELIRDLKNESDGIFLQFEQTEEDDIIIRVEIDEEVEGQGPREIMRLIYPKMSDATPRNAMIVKSPFITQEGQNVEFENELITEDNYEELVENISVFLDKKMKRISATLGIFPSDRMRWSNEEDKLPVYLTSDSLLLALMQYGMNTIHDNASELFEEVLKRPQDPFDEPNMAIAQYRKGWIRPSRSGGYEVVVIAMAGFSSHPSYDSGNRMGKLPFDETKEAERRKFGVAMWTAASARITKTHENGYNIYKERELDPRDLIDSEIMSSMLAGGKSFGSRLEPARQLEIDPNTKDIVERGIVPGTLQNLIEFQGFATANVQYIKYRHDSDPYEGPGTENEIRMAVNVKPEYFRKNVTKAYRYRGELTNRDQTNLEPPVDGESFRTLLQMDRLQKINLLRALLAAPDISGGKRDLRGNLINE